MNSPSPPVQVSQVLSSGSIEVRPMVTEDSDFAGRLSVEAFDDKFRWAAGDRNMEKVIHGGQDANRLMESEYHRIFVALVDGERAGVMQINYHNSSYPDGTTGAIFRYLSCWPTCRLACLGCLTEKKSGRTECYVNHICVDSKFRGKGVGKILLDKAESEAIKNGCTFMSLMVTTTNRARHLYERQGYETKRVKDGCCFAYCAMGVRKFYVMEKILDSEQLNAAN